MRKFLLVFLLTVCFYPQIGQSQNRVGDWQTFTNMMSIRQLQVIDGQVYATTNGGLLIFDTQSHQFTKITNIDGLTHTDLQDMLVDANNQIWLSTGAPQGDINILNGRGEISQVMIPLDQSATVSINHLVRDGNDIYGAATRNLDNIVVQYNRQKDGGYEFKDSYPQFPLNPGHINDITIFEDKIYLATEVGLISTREKLSANPNPNLKDPSSWEQVAGTATLGAVSRLAARDNVLYFASTSTVWALENDAITELPFNVYTSTVNNIQVLNDTLYAGARYGVFKYMGSGWRRMLAEQVPVTVIGFDQAQTMWLGTEYYGIARVNPATDSVEFWQPNVPFDNEFSAMEFTPDGRLVAANSMGLALYQDGVWSNILDYPRIPDRAYIGHLVDEHGGNWMADSINYRAARPYDIAVRGESDVFVSHEGQGVLHLDLNDIHNYEVYDTTDGHLSGSEGIGSGSANFIITRDITLDHQENLWIGNAFAANGNALTTLTPDGRWMHFNIANPNIQGKLNLLPTEIAVDQQNRIWIASARKEDDPKSNGGIAVLDFNGTLTNQSDDRWIWLNITTNGLAGMTVYSITITSDNIAYIVTDGDKRVQKYRIPTELPANRSEIYFQTDRVDELIGVFPLIESEKDIRNNIWFISANNGIKMRTARGELLNDAQGYSTDNSPLLSNNVYAIESAPNNGITYFATDFGISAVTTQYAEPRPDFSDISTYPSPYYIPNEDNMIIDELPDDSEVKILTVTGQVVRTLTPNEGTVKNRQAFWDGTNESGDLVGSGVYFVYCYTQNGEVKTTKALVVRQ